MHIQAIVLVQNTKPNSIVSFPFVSLFIFLFWICISYSPAIAGDEPFTYPSNGGFTGIMEVPTARVMKENRYRVGVSEIDPYRYYYVAFSPVRGIELSGKITEILGVPASAADPRFSGYGNEKDKSFGARFQIIHEDKWAPAIALDIMDPQGTRLYPSQSLIATKQIYPFDFTIGFANGRFGKRPLPASGETFKAEMLTDPKSWLRDGQFFGGVQIALSEKYALMAEYSPIRYELQTSDPAEARYFTSEPPSRFNFGFRWKPFSWTEIDTTYQRGNQLGINLSVAFDIGEPLVPIYNRPYVEKSQDLQNPLSRRLVNALYASGFRDIGVLIDKNDLWIGAKNDRYYYSTKALAVIASLVAEIVPSYFQTIHIALTENGIPVLEFTTTRYDIGEWYADRLAPGEFLFLSGVDTTIREWPQTVVQHSKIFGYGVRPAFQTLLNDPSGFFKYRLGAEGFLSYYPWNGMTFVASLEGYPLNNISTVNQSLDDAIRSDLPLYKEKKLAMARLMFDQIYKMDRQTYGRFSGGYLETEYAGLDAEVAKPIGDGRLMIGVSGSVVKKREIDNVFKLKDGIDGKTYETLFFNTRLNVPEVDAFLDVKTGRFLGGDVGAKFTVSKFINGVVLYAWYSATDTSGFRDPFNRGYHDKGIGITIPLMIFKGADSRTVYNYSISPWTRDVAQDIDHFNTVFDFIGRNLKIYLDRDKGLLYK